jgi:hypothetical protein
LFFFQDHFLASGKATVIITPTATVFFMSLTANLPRGGNSLNDSTHNGLVGQIVMLAESPVLMNFGSDSRTLPVLLSDLFKIFLN